MPAFRSLPFMLAIASLGMNLAHAETPDDAAAPDCFEVVINGERATSFSCLTQKLQPTKPPAGAPMPPQMGSEAIAQRPGNQLGLFNYAATQHRMGENFGKSVHAQRPPPPPPRPVIPPPVSH